MRLINPDASADDQVVWSKEYEPEQQIYLYSSQRDLVAPPEGKRFAGWQYDENNMYDGNGGLTADRNYDFYYSWTDQYYVIFISAGTQEDAQLVKGGEKASRPQQAPARVGYTFKHWSATQDGDAFNFETEAINDNTTLYAVWQAKRVDYTVVYWLEKPNVAGDPGSDAGNYAFYMSEPRQAMAGSAIDFENDNELVALQDIAVPMTYGSGNNEKTYNIKIAEFAFSPRVESVLGNGNTVVNVYFKRVLFTYTFDLGETTKVEATETKYETSGSRYNWKKTTTETQTTTETVRMMEFNGNTYSSSDEPYSFQAKYGQDIEALWPSSANATFWQETRVTTKTNIGTQTSSEKNEPPENNNKWSKITWQGWKTSEPVVTKLDKGFTSWSNPMGGSAWVSKRFTVNDDLLPTETGTLVEPGAGWGTVTQKQVNYWLEATDAELAAIKANTFTGTHETRKFNNTTKTYVLSVFHSQSIALGTTLSAKGIEGVTHVGNVYQGSTGKELDKDSSSTTATYNFYYDRDAFTLSFNTQGGTTIVAIKGVKYGEDISGPNFKPADPARTSYGQQDTFEGWYLDAEYNKPFTFEGAFMPNADLLLFAKWESGQYTVRFFDYASDEEAVQEQKYGHYDYVKADGLYKVGEGYEGKGTFLGWNWYASGYSQLSPYFYEIPVTGDLNLYANWKVEGFKLTYSTGDGTGTAPADELEYALSTQAIVQDGKNLTANTKDEIFYGWKIEGDESGAVYWPGSYLPLYKDTKLVAQYCAKSQLVELVYHAQAPGGVTADPASPVTWQVKKGTTVKLWTPGYKDTNGKMAMIGWAEEEKEFETYKELGADYKIPSDAKTINLYGIWEVSGHVITFEAGDNGSLKADDQTEFVNIADSSVWSALLADNTVAVPGVSANPGYYFAGWECTEGDEGLTGLPGDDYEVKSSLTFVARFAAKTSIAIGIDADTANRSKVYGDNDPAFALALPEGAPDGLADWLEVYRDAGENAGDYTMRIRLKEGKTLDALNAAFPAYAISFDGTATFTITKKAVTLTAGSSTGNPFNGSVYKVDTFTPANGGVVANEALSIADSLSGLAAFGQREAPGSSLVNFTAGTSGITLRENGDETTLTLNADTQTLTGANNYTFTLAPGAVSVLAPTGGDRYTYHVKGAAKTADYDGKEHQNTEFVYVNSSDISRFTLSGVTVGGAVRTNVNEDATGVTTTSVVAAQTFDHDNFAASYTSSIPAEGSVDATAWFTHDEADVPGSMAVTPVKVVVTLSGVPTAPLKVGADEPAVTVVYEAFVNNETKDDALAREAAVALNPAYNKEAAGTYTYTLATRALAKNGNYTFDYGSDDVNITGKSFDVLDAGRLLYNANGVALGEGKLPSNDNNYAAGEKAPVNTGDLSTGHWKFLGWAHNKDATAPDYAKDAANQTHTFTADDAKNGKVLYAVWDVNWGELDFTLTGGEFEYDTAAHSATWNTDPATLDGFSVSYTADGTAAAKNPGFTVVKRTNNAVDAYKVAATVTTKNGADKTFTKTYTADVKITPLTITITAQNQAFTFDYENAMAKTHEVADYAPTQLGDTKVTVSGIAVSGSITYPWQSPVANVVDASGVTVKIGENTVPSGEISNSVLIEKANGALTMTGPQDGINWAINVGSKTVPYNAAEQTLNAWTHTLKEGYTVEGVTVKTGGTNAGSYNAWPEGYDPAENADNSAFFGGIKVFHGTGASKTEVTDYFAPPSVTKGTLEINSVKLTITAGNAVTTFGKDAPAFGATADGFAGGDAANQPAIAPASLTSKYEAGDAAADYDIVFSNSKAIETAFEAVYGGNYTYEFKGGTLTVTPLTIELVEDEEDEDPENYKVYVEVDDAEKPYATPDDASAFTFKSVALDKIRGISDYIRANFDDLFSYSAGRDDDPGEDVRGGGYEIKGTFTSSNNSILVTGTPVSGTLTINQLPVRIAPNPHSKEWGDADPALTATESYDVAPQSWQGFAPAPLAYVVARDAGEDIGGYRMYIEPDPAGQGTLGEQNPNYLITTGELAGEDGFEITKAGVLMINVGSRAKTYGNADPIAPAVNASGLKGGHTLADLNVSVSRESNENVGVYPWNVTYTALENYENITVRKGAFTINQRIAVLVANSYTIEEGDEIPTLTAYVHPDYPLASWDRTLSYSVYRSSTDETAGEYPIHINTGSNPNYDLRVIDGLLTINAPAAPIVVPVVPAPLVPLPVVPPAPAPVDAPAPAPVEIEPDEVPEDAGPVELEEPATPQASIGHWALLNLIIAVLALLMAVVLVVGVFSRRKREEAEETEEQQRIRQQRIANGEEVEEPEDNKGKAGLVWRVLAIVAGVLSPIVFLLTENINNPMVFTDKWTLLMVVLLVVQLVMMLVLRKARQPKDRDDEERQTPAQA